MVIVLDISYLFTLKCFALNNSMCQIILKFFFWKCWLLWDLNLKIEYKKRKFKIINNLSVET